MKIINIFSFSEQNKSSNMFQCILNPSHVLFITYTMIYMLSHRIIMYMYNYIIIIQIMIFSYLDLAQKGLNHLLHGWESNPLDRGVGGEIDLHHLHHDSERGDIFGWASNSEAPFLSCLLLPQNPSPTLRFRSIHYLIHQAGATSAQSVGPQETQGT